MSLFNIVKVSIIITIVATIIAVNMFNIILKIILQVRYNYKYIWLQGGWSETTPHFKVIHILLTCGGCHGCTSNI